MCCRNTRERRTSKRQGLNYGHKQIKDAASFPFSPFLQSRPRIPGVGALLRSHPPSHNFGSICIDCCFCCGSLEQDQPQTLAFLSIAQVTHMFVCVGGWCHCHCGAGHSSKSQWPCFMWPGVLQVFWCDSRDLVRLFGWPSVYRLYIRMLISETQRRQYEGHNTSLCY